MVSQHASLDILYPDYIKKGGGLPIPRHFHISTVEMFLSDHFNYSAFLCDF